MALSQGQHKDGAAFRRAQDSSDLEAQRLKRLEAAMHYFETISLLLQRVQRGDEKAQECPICLGDYDKSEELSVTRCGHIFCAECLESSVAASRSCPTCRKALNDSDYDRISGLRFSGGDKHEKAVSDCQFGTKIGQIVKQLGQIRAENAQGRALIFVQWRSLASKIAAALLDSKVPVLTLHGGVSEQQQTVAMFTAAGAEHVALILAMEDDDSGLNLTCANHVFFVHPMDVVSRHIAVACERQALGRVRRRGQLKEIHLYRFVTEGTVEESLAREFHGEMFGA